VNIGFLVENVVAVYVVASLLDHPDMRAGWHDGDPSSKAVAFVFRQGKLKNYLLQSQSKEIGRNLPSVVLALWPICELSYSFWL